MAHEINACFCFDVSFTDQGRQTLLLCFLFLCFSLCYLFAFQHFCFSTCILVLFHVFFCLFASLCFFCFFVFFCVSAILFLLFFYFAVFFSFAHFCSTFWLVLLITSATTTHHQYQQHMEAKICKSGSTIQMLSARKQMSWRLPAMFLVTACGNSLPK